MVVHFDQSPRGSTYVFMVLAGMSKLSAASPLIETGSTLIRLAPQQDAGPPVPILEVRFGTHEGVGP